MTNIKYGIVTKDDDNYLRIVSKIKKDLEIRDLSSKASYIFAVNEETRKIVSYIELAEYKEEHEIDIFYFFTIPQYKSEELTENMLKIAINHAKQNDESINLYCQLWDVFQAAQKLNFQITSESSYEKEMKRREKFPNSNIFCCDMIMKKENIKEEQIEDYTNANEIINELGLDANIKDPHIFKTDDNYIYCELRKTDEEYDDLINKIGQEITTPNLRVNGGKLAGYIGLEFPELLLYMKDKNTNEIISYVGLTRLYWEGLYISQIAVREDYRRKGIGTELVKEAIERAYKDGIDTVSADINYDNIPSLNMFKKQGFAGYGRYFVDAEKYINNKTVK